jgi:hypothetical protein
MCPGCIASALLMVAGAASIGGVTAFAAKRLRSRSHAEDLEAVTQSQGGQHGYNDAEQTRASENSVPS